MRSCSNNHVEAGDEPRDAGLGNPGTGPPRRSLAMSRGSRNTASLSDLVRANVVGIDREALEVHPTTGTVLASTPSHVGFNVLNPT